MTNPTESWIKNARLIEEWDRDFDQSPAFPIYLLAADDAEPIWQEVIGAPKDMYTGFPDNHWTWNGVKLGAYAADYECEKDQREIHAILKKAVQWELDTPILLLHGRHTIALGTLQSFLARWFDVIGFETFFLTRATGIAGPHFLNALGGAQILEAILNSGCFFNLKRQIKDLTNALR